MKFIYFYSTIYEFYNKHIQQNLNNLFDVEGIKIDNLVAKKGHTFKGGVSIKIELIIEKIEENMNNYIIFSDATIFINNHKKAELCDFFKNYFIYDICFADNNINNVYNIGIILIKCSKKTLFFFQKVLRLLIDLKSWDQTIVNEVIKKEKNLLIGKFEKNKIYCNYYFDKNLTNDFLIFKSFINHKNDIIDNYNQRIEIFKSANLISINEYNNLIKK